MSFMQNLRKKTTTVKWQMLQKYHVSYLLHFMRKVGDRHNKKLKEVQKIFGNRYRKSVS